MKHRDEKNVEEKKEKKTSTKLFCGVERQTSERTSALKPKPKDKLWSFGWLQDVTNATIVIKYEIHPTSKLDTWPKGTERNENKPNYHIDVLIHVTL